MRQELNSGGCAHAIATAGRCERSHWCVVWATAPECAHVGVPEAFHDDTVIAVGAAAWLFARRSSGSRRCRQYKPRGLATASFNLGARGTGLGSPSLCQVGDVPGPDL